MALTFSNSPSWTLHFITIKINKRKYILYSASPKELLLDAVLKLEIRILRHDVLCFGIQMALTGCIGLACLIYVPRRPIRGQHAAVRGASPGWGCGGRRWWVGVFGRGTMARMACQTEQVGCSLVAGRSVGKCWVYTTQMSDTPTP